MQYASNHSSACSQGWISFSITAWSKLDISMPSDSGFCTSLYVQAAKYT